MTDSQEQALRRTLIKWAGGTLAAGASLGLIGCGGETVDGSGMTGGGSGSAGGGVDSGSPGNNGGGNSEGGSEGSGSEGQVDKITSDVAGDEWASGGTAALKAPFPPENPFEAGLGKVCRVTPSYTLGPCYFNPDDYRQDISEGELGVPMILVFKLVDKSCKPVANADVDIWHTNAEGLYSGNASGSSDASEFAPDFCTSSDNRAMNSRWFRGVQKTDAQGMAYFKSCFPGWYPGRTTHIHFKIVHQNKASLISQFCFEDKLSNQIYKKHGDYTGKAKDTLNKNDGVFSGDFEELCFYIKANPDLSMTAYKAIQIDA